jgi:hypothetical protein
VTRGNSELLTAVSELRPGTAARWLFTPDVGQGLDRLVRAIAESAVELCEVRLKRLA